MLFGLTFPLLTFQEIWKGSNPEFLIQGTKWRRSPRSFLIFSWWLTSLALPVLIALPFLPTSFEGYVYESWFFLGVGLVAVYWLLSILLVIRINRRQMAKFRALARQGLG
ncbi:MAG TPA: hypothetical protein ENJ82_17645 [Bacteroidetes bacterium]|nr:hypothetical protein [Bacteroidota bacterium]